MNGACGRDRVFRVEEDRVNGVLVRLPVRLIKLVDRDCGGLHIDDDRSRYVVLLNGVVVAIVRNQA